MITLYKINYETQFSINLISNDEIKNKLIKNIIKTLLKLTCQIYDLSHRPI